MAARAFADGVAGGEITGMRGVLGNRSSKMVASGSGRMRGVGEEWDRTNFGENARRDGLAKRDVGEEARRNLVGNIKEEVVASGSGQRREAGRSGEQSDFEENVRRSGRVEGDGKRQGGDLFCSPVFSPCFRSAGEGLEASGAAEAELAVFGQNARWRGIVKLEWQWRGNEVSCFPVFVPSRRSAGGALGEGGAVVAEWPLIGENEGMTRKVYIEIRDLRFGAGSSLPAVRLPASNNRDQCRRC